jgi:tRNA pseudouridine55 synthase
MLEAASRPGAHSRRAVDGVLLLDKPVGPSSTRVLGHVKHLLHAAKAGHGGTLDPMASGLLPVMFGDATKFASEGLDADKTYMAEVTLGSKTTTGDREGDVVATRPPVQLPQPSEILGVLAGFMGPQRQIPPMHSALKKDGRPLYEYARAGVDVDRTPRDITIHELELVGTDADGFSMRVTCSKGTYVRTLAEDIGAALGWPAHLRALRRIGVGRLHAGDEVVSLKSFENADDDTRLRMLKPVDWLIRELPVLHLDSSRALRFSHGQSVTIAEAVTSDRVRVYGPSGRFLGTGRLDLQHALHPERLRANNP